jgi:2,3-bisphosphoglycerate-dependent phosphoglycerate mutase
LNDALTRVVAVRHGETDWNAQTRIQGQIDIGLNAVGRQQAERLARALADAQFDAVYASDLQRAADTARALAERAGLPLHTEVSLRERGFGTFEGLTWAEVEQQHPDESRRWRERDTRFGPPGGETLAVFYERAVTALAAIAARHRGQHIAIVTHGGVLDALYRAASRIAIDAPRTWQLGNASINRVLHGEQGFTMVGWNDNLHLHLDPAGPALDEASA